MHTRHSLHAPVLALLNKHGKVSSSAVAAFLQVIDLARSGLRLAHLVDSLSLSENSVGALQDLINQDSAAQEACFVLHESETAQTFIVNLHLARLLPSCEHNTTYIDVSTGEAAELDSDTRKAITTAEELVSEHAKNHQEVSRPLVIMLANSLSLESTCQKSDIRDIRLPRVLITLTGILLEYPFVYFIPSSISEKDVQSCLSSRPLVIAELLLESITVGDDQPHSVIKFSLPQTFKDTRPSRFNYALAKSKAVYQARIKQSFPSANYLASVHWKVKENVTLAQAAL